MNGVEQDVCRPGCAACCIAPSIKKSFYGMPNGKEADQRCGNLSEDNLCLIHGASEYPSFCKGLKPSLEMCGNSNEHALDYLGDLEKKTRP